MANLVPDPQRINNNDAGWSVRSFLNGILKIFSDAINKLYSEKIDRSEMANYGYGVKRYKAEVEKVSDLPKTGNEEGDGRVVLADKDPTGKYSFVHLWDGAKWNKTPLIILSSEVATIRDLTLSMCQNALQDINAMRSTKMIGEGLNGASINEDKTKVTVPVGVKGNDSYFQASFNDTDLLKIIKDSYLSNSRSVYAILKYKVNDIELATVLTPRLAGDNNNKIGDVVTQIFDGDYIYLLFLVNADISTLASSLRVGVQFYPKDVMLQEFTFEYIDSTFFIRENSTYSTLLAEKVSERKYVSTHNFGSALQSYSRFGKFVGGIACNNVPSDVDGYLKSIYLKVNGTGGMLRFGIGIIDQRNWAIIRDQFSLKVVSGLQLLDVIEKKILFNKDERLFVFLDDANAAPMFQQGTQASHDMMLYNDQSADGALYKLASTYGGYLTLSWTVEVVSSPLFATKPAVEKNTNDIKSINESIIQVNSQLGTAPDYFGNRYELKVVGDKVVPIPMIYEDSVIITNSIGRHPILPGVWFGDWGMAASQRERDLVHILQRGLRNKIPTATAVGSNIAQWERNFSFDKDALLGDVLTPNRDLIVFRLGENIPNDTDPIVLENAFEELVLYAMDKCPSAKIVVTGVLYTNVAKDIPLSNVAKKYGLTYVKLSDLYIPANIIKAGDIVWGDDGEQHIITKESNVPGHPNDNGQGAIGNRLLTAVGYDVINQL